MSQQLEFSESTGAPEAAGSAHQEFRRKTRSTHSRLESAISRSRTLERSNLRIAPLMRDLPDDVMDTAWHVVLRDEHLVVQAGSMRHCRLA